MCDELSNFSIRTKPFKPWDSPKPYWGMIPQTPLCRGYPLHPLRLTAGAKNMDGEFALSMSLDMQACWGKAMSTLKFPPFGRSDIYVDI